MNENKKPEEKQKKTNKFAIQPTHETNLIFFLSTSKTIKEVDN